ncbi:MAG: hypothetical protein KME04_19760 [Pleurocapsa minor GSE-CHR-MK-17-07R]|jgi:hypothetical protein|nr:hypothetical protein [Pleurocapsa minor GSE-CHR-MK 17-07R]
MTRRSLQDYLRAFVKAVRMTASGQTPQTLKNEQAASPLLTWCRESVRQVDAIKAAAAAEQVDLLALTVRVDKRDLSLLTILETVRFHAAEEFPHLVRQGGQYATLAIQASNLNDRFAVLKASECVEISAQLAGKIGALGEHLAQPPRPGG